MTGLLFRSLGHTIKITLATLLFLETENAQAVEKPHAIVWDLESPVEFVASAYFAATGKFPPTNHPDLRKWVQLSESTSRRLEVWHQILQRPEYKALASAKRKKDHNVCTRWQPNVTQNGIWGRTEFYCHRFNYQHSGGSCRPANGPNFSIFNKTRNQATALIAHGNIYGCKTSWGFNSNLCKKRCGTIHAAALDQRARNTLSQIAHQITAGLNSGNTISGNYNDDPFAPSGDNFLNQSDRNSASAKLSIQTECTKYADTAVQQYKTNLRRGCGFKGAAWQGNWQTHFDWCENGNHSRGTGWIKSEQTSRTNKLLSCY